MTLVTRWRGWFAVFALACGPLAGVWSRIMLADSPRVPDPSTGHVIAHRFGFRGVDLGTHYVTSAQYGVWIFLVVPFLILIAYVAVSLLWGGAVWCRNRLSRSN